MGDRQRGCAVAALAVLFCFECATLGSRAPAPARSARSASQTGELRVMSFNVRVATILDGFNSWGFRKDALVETVRRFDPDLLGTQECLASQARFLRGELRGYQFFGAGRKDGDDSGEMCGIFFKSTKFQQVDGGHFWLSKKPAKPGSKSWGAWWPRLVTWVKLRPTDGSPSFYVFNTHFDVGSRRARAESAKLLRRQIDVIAGTAPVVVTGDFNDDEGSTPYRTLVSSRRGSNPLHDTYRAVHPRRRNDEGTRHSFHGTRDGERIDWILASAQFHPIAADIDRTRTGGRYPSDHFAVTARLRIPNKPEMLWAEAR